MISTTSTTDACIVCGSPSERSRPFQVGNLPKLPAGPCRTIRTTATEDGASPLSLLPRTKADASRPRGGLLSKMRGPVQRNFSEGAIMPERVTAEDIRRYAADPMAFFSEAIIPIGGGDAVLSTVWADWQQDAFREMAVCVKAVAVGQKPPHRGLWLERTKGASKDSDVGLALLWLLMFARRPQTIELAADDQEQSLETYKAMRAVARCNPWIEDRLTIQRQRIVCEATASEAVFLTRDATGSHGSRPTVTVCNELSHCQSEEFISTVADNADKMPGNLFIIATNAGWLGSWQYRWAETTRPTRHGISRKSTPPPWIDPAKMADAQRRNSPTRYSRLWAGQWVHGGGDAIDPADVAACVKLSGPMEGWQQGYIFAGALDLGIRHDHALGNRRVKPGESRARLAYLQSWKPGASGRVDLEMVEADTLQAAKRFRVDHVRYDPWQADLMAQRLRKAGVPMAEIPFVPKHLDLMAKALMNTFRNRKLLLYPEPDLMRDLERVNIAERSWGYKLECSHDEDEGHADRAIALAMLLPAVLNFLDLPMPPPTSGPPMRQYHRVIT